MMQSGLSRELFENWCTDPKNGCIVAGYCVEGTLAKHILSEPEEITAMNGQKLPLKCQVRTIIKFIISLPITLIRWATYPSRRIQITSRLLASYALWSLPTWSSFMEKLMKWAGSELSGLLTLFITWSRLKSALVREYEADAETDIQFYNPRWVKKNMLIVSFKGSVFISLHPDINVGQLASW